MSELIPRAEYLKFIEKMPFVCVDLIIVHQDKYLLVKRKEPPAKDLWWFVGGRLMKNETLAQAATRKAKEEVGLDVTPRRIVNVVETQFDDGPEQIPVHTVNICFLCVAHSDKVSLDGNHDKYEWVSANTTPQDLDNRLKETLEMVFSQ